MKNRAGSRKNSNRNFVIEPKVVVVAIFKSISDYIKGSVIYNPLAHRPRQRPTNLWDLQVVSSQNDSCEAGGGGPSVASIILKFLPDTLFVSTFLTVSAHHTACFGMVSLRIIQK